MKDTPISDKMIIFGDLNARVGCDRESWEGVLGVLGAHGVGNMNSNGLLLLSMCAETNLTITNTLFRMTNKYTTWMHPRSKQWHLIDYVIVCRHDVREV